MSSVIDIHPHIVSPDTKTYPLDPLGGTQSTWSSERPTTYQMMLDAMDEAGVAKAAIVHSSSADKIRSRTRYSGSRTLHFENCSH